jgi:hypothetical protein
MKHHPPLNTIGNGSKNPAMLPTTDTINIVDDLIGVDDDVHDNWFDPETCDADMFLNNSCQNSIK